MIFRSFISLFTDKTLEGISRVHSLTVCMLKGLAEQKGFLNHQFVTLTTKGEVLPAHLIIDSKMKENVAIIKDGEFFNYDYCYLFFPLHIFFVCNIEK